MLDLSEPKRKMVTCSSFINMDAKPVFTCWNFWQCRGAFGQYFREKQKLVIHLREKREKSWLYNAKFRNIFNKLGTQIKADLRQLQFMWLGDLVSLCNCQSFTIFGNITKVTFHIGKSLASNIYTELTCVSISINMRCAFKDKFWPHEHCQKSAVTYYQSLSS